MPRANSRKASERFLPRPMSAAVPSASGSCIRARRYSGDTPVLCAFCVGVRLLRHHFDTGHGRVSLHGNKAQQQLALSVGLKAREPANDHISLARFLEQIEILQQRHSVAEDIEHMCDGMVVW